MTDKSSAAGTGETFSLQIVKKALLKEADKGFQQNFLTSPLSISFFLNLFAVGTKGPVLDRFLKILDAKSLDELHNRTRKLRDIATANGKEKYGQPIVSTANGVWIHQTCTVKDSFREILESVYEIEAKPLDFKNKSEESAEEINSWVSEKTRGLIKDITEAEQISLASIFVANTLYFKAAWRDRFLRRNTKEEIFHLLNGEKINVKFMIMFEPDEYYSYCSSFNGFKILKFPYESGDRRRFYMYFFLPDETNGLRKLIEGFNSVPEFMNQDFDFDEVTIRKLKIPKFKFGNTFDVSKLMGGLGFPMPDLVGTEMIGNLPNHDSDSIKVAQKAFIAVDEKGTEAAAVTYMCNEEAEGFEELPPPEIDFIADHPFLFMIREDHSKVPFFIGVVVNPEDMEKRGEEEENYQDEDDEDLEDEDLEDKDLENEDLEYEDEDLVRENPNYPRRKRRREEEKVEDDEDENDEYEDYDYEDED